VALTDTEREALAWAGLIGGALSSLGDLVGGDAGEGLHRAAGVVKATPLETIAEALATLRTDAADIDEGTGTIDAPDIPVSVS